MKKFYEVSENITKCVYASGEIQETQSFIVESEISNRLDVAQEPVLGLSVSFFQRPIQRMEMDGEPVIRVIHTVDGQRTQIENLKMIHDRDAWRAKIQWKLQSDEHLYGLGQDEDGVLDKRGHISYMYQHNMKIPVPMVVSSRGYAVFVDCGCLMTLDARENEVTWILECVDQVTLYVLTGSMDQIVGAYRKLTGRAAELPAWAFGYWQSKEKYTTQEELLSVARKYRELGIPLDVVVQDWKTWVGDLWGNKHLDKARFPEPQHLKEEMERLKVHTMISVWPNMNCGGRDHQEFAKAGQLLFDYSTYDAFDPSARKRYFEQAAELEQYFDGWWCDNTEPFTAPDWCGEVKLKEEERYRLVGGEHEKYLGPDRANLYALAHAKGFWENQTHKPVVNLTRSGWAGIQKYGAILWAGDTSATWQELKREIAKGINVGLSGIPYWTVDAGAFFVGGTSCWRKWKGDEKADPVWFWAGDYDDGVGDLGYQELYTRWLQFACFLPIFRSHGTDTPREIWNFAEPFRSAIENTIRLRYQLMPYILNMAKRVHEEHFTIMRSLMFDFSEDPEVQTIDDAFMFGEDILVCPVLEPILYHRNSQSIASPAQTRRCYLPMGTKWRDFWTGEVYCGGQWVQVPISIDHIPVFVREDAQLALQLRKVACAEECV